ncbi:MAG: diguanylate cyclase [Desulfovibrio sp.]|nr:diguanylate cyclase [Desulfovibrio sp.]
MRITRFMRDMGWLVVTVIAAAMGIFMASHHFMSEGFEQSFRKEIATMRSVVDDILANTKTRLYQEAILLSDTRELENAFFSLDPVKLTRFATNAMENCRANFATIVDAKGNVMARGHSGRRGDNISESPLIKSALAGNSVVDIVKLTNNGLSVAAAAPIVVDGTIVGAVMFGERLRENAFVDEVKRVTGLEMSVFEKDVRISTTIIRDGKRAIGTSLNNPEVADMVLQRGGTYNADADILGRAYKTVYWPVQNTAGTIYGMWFIGTEVEGVRSTLTGIALSCLLATMVIAAALSVLGVTFFRSLVSPLQKKAYVDKLTGITNRAGYEREMDRIFEAGGRPGGLFLIDLDNFKELNDTLGHPVGDECLKFTGQVLKDIFRETDVVARLGGDEFVVYAPTLDAAEVITGKLEVLLKRLNKDFSDPSGKSVTVTASIGVAATHDGRTDYREMYKIADEALYKSKEGGRNRFTILCCLDKADVSPKK